MTPTTYYVDTQTGVEKTNSMNRAYEWFRYCVAKQEPVRVFKLEFDVKTGALETTTEITGDFADTLQDVA